MNDTQTTTAAAESTTATPETVTATASPADAATETTSAQDQPTTGSDGEQDPNSNAEAAKYRRKLREAEKARDAALEQVDTLRRSIVEQLIEQEHDVKPAAVWANGTTLDEMLTDDGTVDPVAVATAVRSAEDKFGLRPPVGVHVDTEGKDGNITLLPSWADVLNPHRHR
ncbi:hypothetical protein ACPCXD_10615 [Rhodococcus sp. AB351]|uniref:hypothetical protein n=1 Tax=Rhodococcus sp. AB351 TaxID=3413280 RepID=UPI003C1416EF